MECPFVYASGKRCSGSINRLKIVKANIEVNLDQSDKVEEVSVYSNYHVHLYCSEKGNHAGCRRQDAPQMKVWLRELPDDIMSQIVKSPKARPKPYLRRTTQ